jgi:hypothetical protein
MMEESGVTMPAPEFQLAQSEEDCLALLQQFPFAGLLSRAFEFKGTSP